MTGKAGLLPGKRVNVKNHALALRAACSGIVNIRLHTHLWPTISSHPPTMPRIFEKRQLEKTKSLPQWKRLRLPCYWNQWLSSIQVRSFSISSVCHGSLYVGNLPPGYSILLRFIPLCQEPQACGEAVRGTGVMFSGGALSRATLLICKVITIEFWVD